MNGGGVVGDEETYDDETYELPPSFALGASPEGEFEKYIIAIRSTIANFEKNPIGYDCFTKEYDMVL